ncbi:MAG TPA: type II toxin-antitoxin system ParD family antitoxin [Asticcacaulis sp.]|nr:type II toxin-antitoxin system ParD family antitoxin [Asticcacaulis sp.]
MTATMNISMPDSLKAFVDERVRSGGYGSHSEYLRELVRRDEQQAAAERLRALIAEGLNSPQGRDWRDLKADLLKRAAAQG